MPLPSDTSRTGGRLTGDDMRGYMQAFSDKYLKDKIRFQTEVLEIRRDDTASTWFLDVEDIPSGQRETLQFSRIVLCSGVSYAFEAILNTVDVFLFFFFRDAVPPKSQSIFLHRLRKKAGSKGQ
jgi:hypothetical protein